MAFCRRGHGVVNIKINGQSYEFTEADVTIGATNYMREEKPNGHFVVSRSSYKASTVFQIGNDLKIQDLLAACDLSVVLQEANGRPWAMSGAVPTFDDQAWNATQGGRRINWIASEMKEVLA